MRQLRIHQFRMTTAAVVLVVLGLAASLANADTSKNEVLKHWQKFKPGSSATLAATMSMGAMSIQTEMKTTLIEVASDKVTIETETTTIVNGQRHSIAPTRKVIDATGEQGDWVEVGHEKIEAAGKTFDCKVVDGKSTTPTRGGAPSDAKGRIWVNDEVPGGAVQIRANGGGHEILFKLVSFVAK